MCRSRRHCVLARLSLRIPGAWLRCSGGASAKGTAERERAAELAALGLRTMVLAHASAVVRNEKDEPIQKIPSDAAPVLFVIFRENGERMRLKLWSISTVRV